MTTLTLRQKADWIYRGYADAMERTIYKRSPGPDPPELPMEQMPDDWGCYFDGFYAGVNDNLRDKAQ